MNKRNRILTEASIHLIFWFVPTYLIIKNNAFNIDNLLRNEYMHAPFIVNTFLNIILVYANIFLFFPAYRRKKLSKLQYYVFVILIVFACIFLKIMINYQFSLYYFNQTSMHTSFLRMLNSELLFTSFFAVQSILYCIVKDWIVTENIRRKLTEEKLTLELKYLKAQINPHFLYNTLNNLYSIALKNNDEETANGITKLSRIMRYMLDELTENEIAIDKEIDYIKSYIALQKLRFSENDEISINFDIEGNTSGVKIPPFIFIVFIENAFKYGINFRKKSFIHIRLTVDKNRILFNIKNSIHRQDNNQKHGIGLNNVRNRLNLLFPGTHTLDINDETHIFTVNLEIYK